MQSASARSGSYILESLENILAGNWKILPRSSQLLQTRWGWSVSQALGDVTQGKLAVWLSALTLNPPSLRPAVSLTSDQTWHLTGQLGRWCSPSDFPKTCVSLRWASANPTVNFDTSFPYSLRQFKQWKDGTTAVPFFIFLFSFRSLAILKQ